MPRRPRVHLDGVPLHIVQRGHNREPCFFGEEDYLSYLHWLGEALEEFRCALHAYVLMTNHVHLLQTPHRTIGDRPRLSCPGLSAAAAFPPEPREGGFFEMQRDDRLEAGPRKCGQTTCIRNRFRARNNVVCPLFLSRERVRHPRRSTNNSARKGLPALGGRDSAGRARITNELNEPASDTLRCPNTQTGTSWRVW